MLEFLEGLTTIQGADPRPLLRRRRLSRDDRGGKLGIHADFRVNEQLHLHRRLNVIIYLNEHWDDAYGGNLELWSRDMKEKRHEVAPLFNRCVVFNTDATSYHGHPDPLDRRRRRRPPLHGAVLLHGIEGDLQGGSQHLDHLPGAPGGLGRTHREARSLRLDQHVTQWVPPALQRYVFA